MSPPDLQNLKELLHLLLLIPFAVVVGGGFMFLVAAARWVRERKFRNQLAQFDIPAFPLPMPQNRAVLFDRPSVWLAIKGTDIKKVQTALGLHDTTACSWEEGMIEAREHKLFISPSVAGWILVVGLDLPDPGDDVDECFHFLNSLSRKVGHLQYFCANRALNHHAWAIVDRGQVFRAYAWAGQTLWNQGPVTAAEKEIGLACCPYDVELDFSERDALVSNTEKVSVLAARWSIDPVSVAENARISEQGIVGSFSPFHPH